MIVTHRMTATTPWTTGPQGLSAVMPPEWTKDALCTPEEAHLYTALDAVGGRYTNAMVDLAREVADWCYDCPVMLQCGLDATPEEKYWTIRGGEIPGVLAAYVPCTPPAASTRLQRTHCKKAGHEIAVVGRDSRGCCKACALDYQKQAIDRKREARRAARMGVDGRLTAAEHEAGQCAQGHDLSPAGAITGQGFCAVCMVARKKEQDATLKRRHRKRKVPVDPSTLELAYDPSSLVIFNAHNMGTLPT